MASLTTAVAAVQPITVKGLAAGSSFSGTKLPLRPTRRNPALRSKARVVAKYGDKSVYFDLEDLPNTTGQWDLYGSDAPSPYNPLQFSGKTVGIIGLGRIGSAIAKRAEAFGCSICYHSRTQKPNTNYKYHPDLISLATDSDVLVVACPLTAETRRIVGRAELDALGSSGVLVNVGRGSLVDEAELISALIEGRLGGAGLDVFEQEPRVPEILFSLDNVVLTPHVGSATAETRRAMADLVLENLEAHAMNRPLPTPVL